MNIHPRLFQHTFYHFIFSFLFFCCIKWFINSDEQFVANFFGYFVCLGVFAFIGPALNSTKTKEEIGSDKYVIGTWVILFINIFVPLLSIAAANHVFSIT